MDKQKNKPKKGLLIISLIRLTYITPRWLVLAVGFFSAWLGKISNSRNYRVVKRNLELCFPEFSEQKKLDISKLLVQHNALLAKEVATAWVGSDKSIKSYLQGSTGEHLLKQAQQNSLPLIIAVPHIGNWEFFWHWLQMNYPAISMYTPAQYQALDEMMLNARQRFGGRPFATDPKGIMGLLRSLKKSGVMMILPDQVPKNEGGVFVPFFNHQAFTMTLVHKFVEKTGAQLCFGACIRQPDGKFQVEIESASFETAGQTAEAFNRQMNSQLEAMIRRNPEQYQWNYKRFKSQPDGSDLYR